MGLLVVACLGVFCCLECFADLIFGWWVGIWFVSIILLMGFCGCGSCFGVWDLACLLGFDLGLTRWLSGVL